MAKEKIFRYIITRDYELPDGKKGRQCWTGFRWSKEIKEALVYHSYPHARRSKYWLDEAVRKNPKTRVPGLKIMQCDIRQLLPTDLPEK